MPRLGPYELIERIGIGGMAEVFKASQSGEEGFERLVAVKRILPDLSADPEFEKMFIDEAKIAVQCQHPNIAQIYDLGREEDSLFIALEYVDGRDMKAIQERQSERRGKPLPLSFVVQVALKVCEALHHAHTAKGPFGKELGLIHRDITPHNILVSFEGAVKVVDFGLAKAAGRRVTTQAGVVKGKLAYLSAEQARGEDVDSRSDIFSLGTCLFEWLTDQRLFLRRNDPETVMAVQRAEVPPLRAIRPELPLPLDGIVRKALQPDPDRRYASAMEMQEDLTAFAMDAGMPVRRRRLVEVLRDLFPEEADGVVVDDGGADDMVDPAEVRSLDDNDEPLTREIPDVDEALADAGDDIPRDTIPAAPADIPADDDYEDSTNVMLEVDEAVMQVLTAPRLPREAEVFEDEVSAVPVVEHDSSMGERPPAPPGRAPLTAPGPNEEAPPNDAPPPPLDGESTGDFAYRADALARSSEERARTEREDATTPFPTRSVQAELAKGTPGAPKDLGFDETTANYDPDQVATLLAEARIQRKKNGEPLVFPDETVDERPADDIEQLLDELEEEAEGPEPLEGEATRTDGSMPD